MPKNAANTVPTFRHRITHQTESSVSDGQGGSTKTWNSIAELWASVEPLKGYERFQAMQMQTPVTHRITVRYNADITTASRFLFGTRIFCAQEVINIEERNRFLVIKAVERQ